MPTVDKPDIKKPDIKKDAYQFGFHDKDEAVLKLPKGLSKETVNTISDMKNEPSWMRALRLRALEHFEQRPMPQWGGQLNEIDFNAIHYFVRASAERDEESWEDVPDYIRNTYDKLGIPEAERKGLLAGVGAQYDSEVVYHSIREDLEAKGVLFLSTDQALQEHEDLVREYFTTLIPANDNKFAALNTAVWSGGSFIWVPEGVEIDVPLQAYFRINSADMGQFERTLIIAEPGSKVHYVEGCTAPIYSSDSLHSAVVEIIVKPGANVRYTTNPELVQQRLQPGHQAGRGLQRRRHELGGRQPGQQVDHEVPLRLPDGAGGARGGPLARLRRPGTAPGRRRQDGACGAPYHFRDHEQELGDRRRAHFLPRSRQGVRGRQRLPRQRPLRRPHAGRSLPLRHLPLHGDR